jgi:hypothetical protein
VERDHFYSQPKITDLEVGEIIVLRVHFDENRRPSSIDNQN